MAAYGSNCELMGFRRVGHWVVVAGKEITIKYKGGLFFVLYAFRDNNTSLNGARYCSANLTVPPDSFLQCPRLMAFHLADR